MARAVRGFHTRPNAWCAIGGLHEASRPRRRRQGSLAQRHQAADADLASFHLTDAKPPARTEAGWKDTVQVPPGGVTRILIVWGDEVAGSPFTGPTYTVTPEHEYVWHCHILEHEENDMMQWYGPTASGN